MEIHFVHLSHEKWQTVSFQTMHLWYNQGVSVCLVLQRRWSLHTATFRIFPSRLSQWTKIKWFRSFTQKMHAGAVSLILRCTRFGYHPTKILKTPTVKCHFLQKVVNHMYTIQSIAKPIPSVAQTSIIDLWHTTVSDGCSLGKTLLVHGTVALKEHS